MMTFIVILRSQTKALSSRNEEFEQMSQSQNLSYTESDTASQISKFHMAFKGLEVNSTKVWIRHNKTLMDNYEEFTWVELLGKSSSNYSTSHLTLSLITNILEIYLNKGYIYLTIIDHELQNSILTDAQETIKTNINLHEICLILMDNSIVRHQLIKDLVVVEVRIKPERQDKPKNFFKYGLGITPQFFPIERNKSNNKNHLVNEFLPYGDN